ncbi:MAG: Type secretory pathway VirD4 component-like [Frankiales bacterium]|nr:Type secretory pathway VirD4 component-like [Frankiales bacterium]
MSSSTLEPPELLTLAGLALLAVAHLIGWGSSGLAALAAGHGWRPLPLPEVTSLLLQLPGHLDDPALAYPAAIRNMLPGTAMLWITFVLATGLVLGLALVLTRVAAAATGGHGGQRQGGGRGLATRTDIRQHLGERAVRQRAPQTRPSLAGTRRYPTSQVGLALGHDLCTGQQIWGSVEDSYLILGPPRSGKGVHLVIPHTLDAPGAVLVTSTRPDTLRVTQARRAEHGPVLAFDPQQLAADVPRLRWSPTRGCIDPLVAINRARALAAGAQLTKGTTSDGEFWTQMAAAVLRGYLHAAALTDRPISDVLAWASRPQDPTPVRILKHDSGAAPGWAEELAAQAGADPRQRDSVWAGVRRAVDSLADPRVLDTCSPSSAEQFNPADFLDSRGTLYLLGTTGAQLSVAPLISALIEDLLDTARSRAATLPAGRLDPPLFLLLDEAANIAPIPTLPNLLADGGGTGITTVAILQSLAQARARWGEAGADALWDASTTKVVLGGLAHADDLSRISRLVGDIDQPTLTRSHGAGGSNRSISTQRLPALPLEQIRCLPTGQALVLARQTPPVRVRLTPWWRRPDAPHTGKATP